MANSCDTTAFFQGLRIFLQGLLIELRRHNEGGRSSGSIENIEHGLDQGLRIFLQGLLIELRRHNEGGRWSGSIEIIESMLDDIERRGVP